MVPANPGLTAPGLTSFADDPWQPAARVDILEAFRGLGRIGLMLAILAGPLVVWRRGIVAAAVWRGRAGLHGRADATVLSGCLTGAVLFGQALPAEALDLAALLGVGGIWDRPASALPDLLWDLATEAPRRLAAAWDSDARGDVRLLLAAAAAPFPIQILLVGRALPRNRISRLLLAETMVFAMSAGGAAWAFALLCWGVNQLNVWLILIAIVVIQDVRYGHPPVTPRVAARLWRSRTGP